MLLKWRSLRPTSLLPPRRAIPLRQHRPRAMAATSQEIWQGICQHTKVKRSHIFVSINTAKLILLGPYPGRCSIEPLAVSNPTSTTTSTPQSSIWWRVSCENETRSEDIVSVYKSLRVRARPAPPQQLRERERHFTRAAADSPGPSVALQQSVFSDVGTRKCQVLRSER